MFIITTAFTIAWKSWQSWKAETRKEREETKEHECTQDDALQQILHDNFYKLGIAAIDAGEIDPDQLDIINRDYNAYHNLGGNSTGTAIWKQVCELKIVPSRNFFVAQSMKEDKSSE